MAYNPNLIAQFVQQQRQDPLLTNIGAGINQLVMQKREKRKKEEKEATYQDALGTFMEDETRENYVNLLNADPQRFENEFKPMWDSLNEWERTQTVQSNAEMMGFIAAGMGDKAIEKARTMSEAYRNEGDLEDAEVWNNLATKMEEGDFKSVSTFLMGINSAIPEGREANESIFAREEEERAAAKYTTDFIESGVGIEYQDEAHKNRVLVAANKMKDAGLARLYAEMGSVIGEAEGGGLDANQLADFTFKLNKEYNTRIEDYRTTSDAAKSIYAAVKPESGFSDDAILKLFNKVLDPDSVVRQSELEATLEAQGKLEEFKNLIPKWGTGVTLNEDTRPKLLEIVRLLDESAQQKTAGIQEEMNPLVDKYVTKERRDLVYGPLAGAAPVETEAEDAHLQAMRAEIRRMNPDSTGKIEEMSLAELEEGYGRSFPVASEAVGDVVPTRTIDGEVFEEL